MNAEQVADTIHRAYSVLTVKAADDDAREIEGIATTPTPDSYDDIVEPKGAEFNLAHLPLLWQHRSSDPVGAVTKAKVTNDGISVTAKFAKIATPGKLKDRLDEAWDSVKAGLVRGLSIGFRAREYAFLENGGIHFLSWRWLELSLVTIPANEDAGVTALRSICTKELAASGRASLRRGAIRLLQPSSRVGIVHRAATGPVKLIR